MKIKFAIPDRLRSRKFWLAIASAVIVFLNKAYDWGLDEKEILAIVASLLSFVLVEGYADIKRTENQ
jgi:uncharacterized membrane protein